MGHRKYLPRHHPYRLQKKNFDGKQEHENPLQPLSGEAIHFKLKEMIFSCGNKCGKNNNEGGNDYWKRRSDFFELPYWKNLHVRYCLDVMHIEKNVCMNIVGTLLDIPGKSKDEMNSRLDLVEMNIRPESAPMVTGNRTYIPAACYTLSREEKYRFCKTLSEIKVPEGYSSNIRGLVFLDDLKLNDLKSHDCHVLMQQLLPIVIRLILPKNVRYTISRLCFFFNAICAKSFSVSELDALQEDIVMILCNLEKYFPPSFFTIMVHLVVHLVREVKLCGPVYFRWMYGVWHTIKYVITVYLYTRVESSRTLNLYKFVDAESISYGSSKEEQAQLLTARLLGIDYDKLLLIPYNSGNHWTLVVINLTKSAAFWINPLKNRIDPDVTDVVERSFNIMNKKKPNWRVVKMKDSPRAYTHDDIDCIRSEWAEFVGKHVHCA
ncbi:hypothetical protein IC575_028137 [Cucumis melo]